MEGPRVVMVAAESSGSRTSGGCRHVGVGAPSGYGEDGVHSREAADREIKEKNGKS